MKYHNRKIETDEGTFDSTKEFNRWLYLKDREALGEIEYLRRQVVFELIPNQYENGKLKERKVTYIADFVYIKNGIETVEDVKPTDKNGEISAYYKATAAYKVYVLKRKMMLYKYGITIQEV